MRTDTKNCNTNCVLKKKINNPPVKVDVDSIRINKYCGGNDTHIHTTHTNSVGSITAGKQFEVIINSVFEFRERCKTGEQL